MREPHPTQVELTPLATGDRLIVEAYGDGGFQVGGTRHRGSLLLLPDQVLAWPISDFSQVTAESLAPLWRHAPNLELVLLGCGPRLMPLDPALRQAVRAAAGPALEPMDSRRRLPYLQPAAGRGARGRRGAHRGPIGDPPNARRRGPLSGAPPPKD